MNIALFRLKPLLRELRAIHHELARMNDIRELELAHSQGLYVRPPVADTSGAEPDVLYTNEESDYFTELQELLGKVGKKEPE